MVKMYRIEVKYDVGGWTRSMAYPETYDSVEALHILERFGPGNARMVHGYTLPTDEEVFNPPDKDAVWVLAVRKYNGGADDVLGVFSTEDKATLHLGQLALTTGVDHDYEYEVVKFTIDKGKEG